MISSTNPKIQVVLVQDLEIRWSKQCRGVGKGAEKRLLPA